MAKRLTHTMTYDAPLAQVSAMLDDSTFREEVCAFQRVLSATVAIDETPEGMRIVVDQVQPAQGIPSFAKKFVGEEIRIVQTEIWSSETAADLHVTIPGKPGAMTGTITLTEAGATTTETVDVEVKVNIPLVSGRIESLIADLLRKALVAEESVGRDYLSR
jgi:hypothetical protein